MFDLKDLFEIYEKHKDDYDVRVEEFVIGNKQLNFNSKTALLGIINLSTDSWWNHAISYTPEQALRSGKVLTAQGADIIDIGAEATASHAQRADDLKQNSSLLPVIEALSQEGILTSIDTYYPEVARECLKVGANVINFTGTDRSEEMYRLVSEFDAAIIICYVQGKHARDVGDFDYTNATDPIALVYDFFAKEIEIATKLGVKKIFIDPAIGLGYKNFYNDSKNIPKRLNYQLRMLLNSFRLRKLGFPVLNQVPTPLELFAEEVRSAQVFTSLFAALGKSDMLRTHEVSKLNSVLECLRLM